MRVRLSIEGTFRTWSGTAGRRHRRYVGEHIVWMRRFILCVFGAYFWVGGRLRCS